MKKSTIAIIPARGGSKRLLNKNILPFCGEPLVTRSVKVALASDCIDKVIITSDSDIILNLILENIPSSEKEVICVKRPERLATDTATQIDVIDHVIKTLGEATLDSIVLLQPTSPLRTSNDIDEAYKMFMSDKSGSVVSFGELNNYSQYSTNISKGNNVDSFIDDLANIPKRSQDLEKEYGLNGAIYICSIAKFMLERNIFIKPCRAYIMPYERSFDIDEEVDFKICEYLYNLIHKNIS